MINICIDHVEGKVRVEGRGEHEFRPDDSSSALRVEGLTSLLRDVLDQAFYSGEPLCLEVRTEAGYQTINKWWRRSPCNR